MRASLLLPLALGCLCRAALAEGLAAEEACEDAELARADLLQVGLSRAARAARAPSGAGRPSVGGGAGAVSRAESLKPVYWVHVAKAGSTFASVLLNNPTLCPGFVGSSEGLLNEDLSTDDFRHMLASPGYFKEISSACPGAFQGRSIGSHDGLSFMSDEERLGHGTIMLRQPEQRVISSFNDNQHDWPQNLKPAASVREYALAVSGCAVKMLTRGGKNVCENQTEALDTEVAEAVGRLESDFAFVGLTEEWYLSVCLFHAMFGGAAASVELMNRGSSSPYDTSDLEGWTDRFDGPVYEKATQLFQMNIGLYGLSEGTCASLLGQ